MDHPSGRTGASRKINHETRYRHNITGRYARGARPVARGKMRLLIRVLDRPAGKRVAAEVTARDPSDEAVKHEGTSRDENADLNNLLSFDLTPGYTYKLRLDHSGKITERDLRTDAKTEETVTIPLAE